MGVRSIAKRARRVARTEKRLRSRRDHGKNVPNNKLLSFKTQDKKEALLAAFLATFQHFFGSFTSRFKDVTDSRDQDKITYPTESLIFTAMLMFASHLGSRRKIKKRLRKSETVTENFEELFSVQSVPHGDTVDGAFCGFIPAEFQEKTSSTVESLLRRKLLSQHRLLNKYYVIATDGSGYKSSNKRCCPYCLTQKHNNGSITYYHMVLESKLVTPSGFAFSSMSEFVENTSEKPSKQDCELRAFSRLAWKLKQRFPRLPISLALDGLYAGGPTFALCETFGWKYMITLKEGKLPAVCQEFEELSKLQPENHLVWYTGKKSEIKQEFRWVNDISYTDSKHREHRLSVIECVETKPGRAGELETTTFRWVTNHKVSASNVIPLANDGGRVRWKVENEGFNTQKNGGYELEHTYSNNDVAAKIWYFLLQISHLIMQLLEKGDLLRKVYPDAIESKEELSFLLLEAWRNARFPSGFLEDLPDLRFQIRFNTS